MQDIPKFSTDPHERQGQVYDTLKTLAAAGNANHIPHLKRIDSTEERKLTDRAHEIVELLDFNVTIDHSSLSRVIELSMERRHSGIATVVLPKYKIAMGENWEKPLGNQPAGHTFVRFATMCGEIISAKAFLDAGASANAALESNNETPIIVALGRYTKPPKSRDSLDFTQILTTRLTNLLLDHDADPTIKSIRFGSALDIARRAKKEIDPALLGRIEGIAAQLEAQRAQSKPKRRGYSLRSAAA